VHSVKYSIANLNGSQISLDRGHRMVTLKSGFHMSGAPSCNIPGHSSWIDVAPTWPT
jgi:hypothetical protein